MHTWDYRKIRTKPVQLEVSQNIVNLDDVTFLLHVGSGDRETQDRCMEIAGKLQEFKELKRVLNKALK